MSTEQDIRIDNSNKSGFDVLDTIGQVDPENATYFTYEAQNGEEVKQLITYPEVSYSTNYLLHEDLPGLFHSSFAVENFYFASRIDQFAVIDPGKKALFIDVGLYDLCGVEFLDEALKRTNTPWDKAEILITHSHDDHDGNVEYCLNKGAQKLYMGNLPLYHQDRTNDHLARCGLGRFGRQDVYFYAERLLNRSERFDGFRDKLTTVKTGDIFKVGDYCLEVLETPGHTLEHVALIEREKGLLFAGDHVLETAPGLMSYRANVHVLQRFLESFEYLKTLHLNRVFMCHRDPLIGEEEINAFFDAIIQSYDRPVNKMLSMLEKDNPLTIYELAQKYYAYLPSWENQPLIMLSRRICTAFSYLEYLYDCGKAKRQFAEDGAIEYWLA